MPTRKVTNLLDKIIILHLKLGQHGYWVVLGHKDPALNTDVKQITVYCTAFKMYFQSYLEQKLTMRCIQPKGTNLLGNQKSMHKLKV